MYDLMPFSAFQYHDCLYGWCLKDFIIKEENKKLTSLKDDDLFYLPFADLFDDSLEESDVGYASDGGYDAIDS